MPSLALNDSWLLWQRRGRRWLEPVWQRLVAVEVPRWRQLLTGLAVAWLLASVARLVWLLLPLSAAPAQPAPAPVNAVAQAQAGAAAPVDIEAMVAWHLFGEAGAKPATATGGAAAAAAGIEEQAADTSLNLQLQGVMSASEAKLARALILAEGRQQQYTVGEQLPASGKVVLAKVLVDRAIIDNNGRYETLWLYDPNAAGLVQPQPAAQAQPAVATVDKRGDAAVTALAQDYRQQLYQNPSGLTDVMQLSVAREGDKLIGYRVRPGRDPQQFQQFGFRPDDVITAINGVTLDDPQRALELYNLLRNATEATFSVRRGGEELTLVVSLGAAPETGVAP